MVIFILLLSLYGYFLATPPFILDSLYYHYGLPEYWILNQKVVPVFDPFALTPLPTRTAFLFGLSVGGHYAPAWMVFMNLILTALMLGHFLAGKLRLQPPWPLMGIIAFLLTPAVIDFQLLHMIDASVLWSASVLVYLFLNDEKSNSHRRAVDLLVGILGGIMVTTKIGTTFAFAVATLTLYLFRHRPLWNSSLFKRILIVGCGFMLPIIPWVLWATWAGGHPLAFALPYLGNAEIRSTRWFDTIHQASFSFQVRNRPLFQDFFHHLRQFFYPSLPLNKIGGQSGMFVAFLLPVALLTTEHKTLRNLWCLGFLSWYLTFRLTRFSLYLLVIEIAVITLWFSRWSKPRSAIIVLLVTGALNFAIFLSEPVRMAASLDTVNEWVGYNVIPTKKGRYIPPTPFMCEIINRNLNPQKHRLLFVGDYRYYPCQIPFVYVSYFFRHPLEALDAGKSPEQHWENVLNELHITHLVYSPQGARRWFAWPESIHLRFERWLDKRLRLISRVHNRVYQIDLYAIDRHTVHKENKEPDHSFPAFWKKPPNSRDPEKHSMYGLVLDPRYYYIHYRGVSCSMNMVPNGRSIAHIGMKNPIKGDTIMSDYRMNSLSDRRMALNQWQFILELSIPVYKGAN